MSVASGKTAVPMSRPSTTTSCARGRLAHLRVHPVANPRHLRDVRHVARHLRRRGSPPRRRRAVDAWRERRLARTAALTRVAPRRARCPRSTRRPARPCEAPPPSRPGTARPNRRDGSRAPTRPSGPWTTCPTPPGRRSRSRPGSPTPRSARHAVTRARSRQNPGYDTATQSRSSISISLPDSAPRTPNAIASRWSPCVATAPAQRARRCRARAARPAAPRRRRRPRGGSRRRRRCDRSPSRGARSAPRDHGLALRARRETGEERQLVDHRRDLPRADLRRRAASPRRTTVIVPTGSPHSSRSTSHDTSAPISRSTRKNPSARRVERRRRVSCSVAIGAAERGERGEERGRRRIGRHVDVERRRAPAPACSAACSPLDRTSTPSAREHALGVIARAHAAR